LVRAFFLREGAACTPSARLTLVPAKSPKVGDKIRVSIGHQIIDAVIKAVHDEYADGVRYQIDFGREQTALIQEWQIVEDNRV
jgi:hypothetical protein